MQQPEQRFVKQCELSLFSAAVQIEQGPLKGVPAIQSTVGEFSIDESTPARQQVICAETVLTQ